MWIILCRQCILLDLICTIQCAQFSKNSEKKKMVFLTEQVSVRGTIYCNRKNETNFFHRNKKIPSEKKFCQRKNFSQAYVQKTNNVTEKSCCHRKSFLPPTKASVKERHLLSTKQVDRNIICKYTELSSTIDKCV